VPRDRQGGFASQWLQEQKGQDVELEAFLAEAFLVLVGAGSGPDFGEAPGHKYDSKQISRIVSRATQELESWRTVAEQLGRP
jgi:hypothetical protein